MLRETFEVLHRHADVEVVRARRENVAPCSGCLVGHDRVDRSDRRTAAAAGPASRRAFRPPCSGNGAPALPRGVRGGGKRVGRALHHELPRGQVVVWTGVEPEQLGVALDLASVAGVDACGMRDDLLEDVAHLEVVGVALVVIDVASGERGAGTGARSESSDRVAAK